MKFRLAHEDCDEVPTRARGVVIKFRLAPEECDELACHQVAALAHEECDEVPTRARWGQLDIRVAHEGEEGWSAGPPTTREGRGEPTQLVASLYDE